jgi:hypothetical protein
MANSQNNFNSFTEISVSKKQNLPQNRTAFIFSNSNPNAPYSNPAYAMLNTKKDNSVFKNNQTTTVSSFKENTNNISEADVCMYSNTTDDELWIQLNNLQLTEKKLCIEIYNAVGQRVFITSLENHIHKINVCDFSAGTFLIKLGDTVQKMVIE